MLEEAVLAGNMELYTDADFLFPMIEKVCCLPAGLRAAVL